MRGVLYFLSWLIGWVYYKSLRFLKKEGEISGEYKVSVIIPARNEEKNLDKLLYLLQKQTYKPYEVIVVNDNSEDNTEEVAKRYGVKVVSLYEDPPEGWVGKNWAIWNGYLESRGEILLFLDADVEPREEFIEVMLSNYEKYGGLISCWPYQRFEKFYEHLNFIFNIGAVITMCAIKKEGAFGPSMMISREYYEKVGGHKEVRDKVVEDLHFGNLCIKKGVPVNNFLGGEYIKFRMYPKGLRDLIEGFSKNSSQGVVSLSFTKFLYLLMWFYGVFGSFAFENLINLCYLLFSFQLYIISRRLGDYSIIDSIIYPIHFMFFITVLLYSTFKTFLFKSVSWKGRKINVG
ncbi:glycosyl transferase family 2 [Dictyoglomus turgidum DSM 6724]|uniref:Glycosyl transferase family 2 n=1 Tax=Dictyoglomus turgidum (strain DSM 6724 / Z-1310) TaxID=515635 RepID=B8DZ23_DICTD|nr:glycosyl transferase family 2 [Dictyoglomus turgidum DSM 6724]